MKAFKASDSPSSLNPTQNNPHQSPTHPKIKPIYRCTTVLSNVSDCHNCLKKNYFSSKVILPNQTDLKNYRSIIKRSAKYIRTLKPYIHEFNEYLDVLKQAKSIRSLNFLYRFKIFFPVQFQISVAKNCPKKLQHILKTLLRGGISLDSLKSSLFVLSYIWKKCRQKIQHVKSLAVTTNTMSAYRGSSLTLQNYTKITQDGLLNQLLDKFKWFSRLANLNLDFHYAQHDQTFLYEIMRKLSHVPTLRTLNIGLRLENVVNQPADLQETMNKFSGLTSLCLSLDIRHNKDCGNLFTSLLPLNGLEALKLDISSTAIFACEDIAEFVNQLPQLKSLKFSSSYLKNENYRMLFGAIRNLQNLEVFALKQVTQSFLEDMPHDFSYQALNELLEGLVKLKNVTVELPNFTQEDEQIVAFLKVLQSHPGLERVKGYLRRDLEKNWDNFDSVDFYTRLADLLKRLKSFKVKVRSFPDQAVLRIMKLFVVIGQDIASKNCQAISSDNIMNSLELLNSLPVLY